MITLDEASGDIVLTNYFIVRRVFDFSGVNEVRIWDRAHTDWRMHRITDPVQFSITHAHTILIRLPTVKSLTGWSSVLSQADCQCTTVDYTRYEGKSLKGKAPMFSPAL